MEDYNEIIKLEEETRLLKFSQIIQIL